ncbi:MAG: alkaline phosphatase family protein, partial [Pseudomonadota bacterium]
DEQGMQNKHIKLQNVTAIFPSITFASWASIFTGKLPNETGILGNEFFARDILTQQCGPSGTACYNGLPGMWSLPAGVITLDADGGAFRPFVEKQLYSSINQSLPFILDYVMPAEFSGFDHNTLGAKMSLSAPNAALHKTTMPLWDDTNKLVNSRYVTSQNPDIKCGNSQYECRTVSMFNQYARKADWWGTPTSLFNEVIAVVPNPLDSAKVMDRSAAIEATEFIKGYYSGSGLNANGKRKRFPAVFSVYLSGLDHEAHINGLGGYKSYFTDTVDEQVKSIVATLKAFDEFDNKIFIVVADHGETQMPTNLTYKKTVAHIDPITYNVSIWQEDKPINMDCALKTVFQDNPNDRYAGKNAMNDERSNNNLHIWELANLFLQFPDPNVPTKVLVPEQIAKLPKLAAVAASNVNQANIIAALNGHMAHLYIKGATWQSNPDEATLDSV